MKKSIVLVLMFCSIALVSAQTSKNNLQQAILAIVEAYQKKDAKTINSFVHPKWGVTFKYQLGAHTNVSTVEKIAFNDPIPDYLPYRFQMVSTKKITEKSNLEFDCSTEKWNAKPGIYYSRVTKSNSIAGINDLIIKISGKEFGMDRKLAAEISAGSIIVTAFGGPREIDNTFIFYLTPKNGKWYLTAIDRFEVCSA